MSFPSTTSAFKRPANTDEFPDFDLSFLSSKSPKSSPEFESINLNDIFFNVAGPQQASAATLTPRVAPAAPTESFVLSHRERKVLDLFLDVLNTPDGEPLDTKIEKLQQANREADLPDSPTPEERMVALPSLAAPQNDHELDMLALSKRILTLQESSFFDPTSDCKKTLEEAVSLAKTIKIVSIKESTFQELFQLCLEHLKLEEAQIVVEFCQDSFHVVSLKRLSQVYAEKGNKEKALSLIEKANSMIENNISSPNQREFLRKILAS